MNEVIIIILSALWFFLPCGIANSMPVFVMHLPFLKKLNYPLDCYKTFRGVRIFGDHKSWRGLISGIIAGLVITGIQVTLYNETIDLTVTRPIPNCGSEVCTPSPLVLPPTQFIRDISWVDYSKINWVVFGLLAGAGPLLGDAIKSFFKRRMNLKPGATWFPFDQIDYIVGGIVFLLPIVQLDWWKYIIVAIVYFALHLISTSIGYLLKLKDSPI